MSAAPVRALAHVVGTAPLAVHFALLNPPENRGAVAVPRVLLPAGVFVTAQLRRADGSIAWELPAAKPGGLKLDPAVPASYVELEPGYAWGALLVFDGAPAQPGQRIHLRYSSAPYDGPDGSRPLRFEADAAVPGAPGEGGEP